MNKYYVLLLYPEAVAVSYADCFLSSECYADSEETAVKLAKVECATENGEVATWADNFVPMLIVKNGEIC